MEAARRSYFDIESLVEVADFSGICSALPPQAADRLLGNGCPLAARKFLEGTEEAVLAAAAPCDSSLQLLNDGTCGRSLLSGRVLRAWRFGRPALLIVSGLLAFSLTFSLLLLLLLGSGGVHQWGRFM